MFCDNLKRLRYESGFSQEELAARLNVVRQTVSKWEKGLSMPDGDMLIKISGIFSVSVNELLGAPGTDGNLNDVAIQLAHINEQLTIKNRRAKRLWTAFFIILAVLFVLLPTILFLFAFIMRAQLASGGTVAMETEVITFAFR